MDITREACPGWIFYETNILECWTVNVGRFPNLARMARDFLTAQGGSLE